MSKNVTMVSGIVFLATLFVAFEVRSEEWVSATVSVNPMTGATSDFRTFDAKLKEALGDPDINRVGIACHTGCDALDVPSDANAGNPRLEYVFPRRLSYVYSIFADAWDATQKSIGDNPPKEVGGGIQGVHPRADVYGASPVPEHAQLFGLMWQESRWLYCMLAISL